MQHRHRRFREMDASDSKSYRLILILLLTLSPLALGADIDEDSIRPLIKTVQASEDISSMLGNIGKRLIITARALDAVTTDEPDTETENVVDEATEDSTKNTDELYDENDDDDDQVIGSTTESSLYTSTSAIAYSTEPTSTTARQDGEDLHGNSSNREEDLNTASTNLDIHQRRSDGTEDLGHQVLYARLKHPIRPTEPDNTETSVGSIFGRPYNARPFVPRFPGTQPSTADGPAVPVRPNPERGVFPNFERPSSSIDGERTSAGSSDLIWNKPNRWEKEKAANQRFNMTRVQSVDAECQNDYMKIRLRFNGSFSGIIYSTGFAYDPLCVYVNGTGRDYYEFYIQLNRCGTLGGNTHNLDSRKQPTKNFMWNTLSVQYSSLIEEEWDEHYKMTCEYGYDYWKTVTFPFLDVEVATGNPLSFTLTPPECHMEIRSGYGTTGNRVTGPVRVGDPITLVVYMRSQFDGFDVIVSDCYAHNGANKKIQLIDNNGCPINEKLISRFRGLWTDAGLYETQVFAYMKAFRFTGSPALYIECDVRMCHGHCPTQPCYWRNSRDIVKRDVSSVATIGNTTLSENLSLFQAIQVIADDETSIAETYSDNGHSNRNISNPDHICLKPVAIGAVLGMTSLITIALGIVSCILCLRLRRRTLSDSTFYSQHHFTNPAMDNQYNKHRHF